VLFWEDESPEAPESLTREALAEMKRPRAATEAAQAAYTSALES
jgi:hypothetical protein